MEWVRDGQIIEYSDTLRSLQLYISEVNAAHQGEYFCNAAITPSIYGYDGPKSAGYLTVLGKANLRVWYCRGVQYN